MTQGADIIAEGLQFPEGPVWLPDGCVLCVEIAAGTLTAIEPGGKRRVVAKLGGGPNGAALGPGGAVYVCNNGGFKFAQRDGRLITAGTPDDYVTGSIQRVDLATGRFETLYDRCDGRQLGGPNDLVFDAYGGFWFTDPGKLRGRAMDRGSVFYAKADGSAIREVIHPMSIPNGVGLSPDGKTLYVVETETARLWAWPVNGPGELDVLPWHVAPHGGRLVWTAPTFTRYDSLKVEAGGNICIATLDIGAVTVVTPGGQLVEQPRMDCDDTHCTNLCFGDADLQTAWITLAHTGKLVRRRWARPGLQLQY
ncbi:MAG TPA: SMP-30/gluconolactonase/LRE family protein [Burkholderiaceae bacterium]|nr:SMP-30/gluconolactonase/LRE family protein [Burkholderiaceae bacterium]